MTEIIKPAWAGVSAAKSLRVIWKTMRQRCANPNRKGYENYGGRGIAVCPEWDSFEQFKSDMGYRPAGKTLDRIDNDKGYSKENCRWADWETQAANRRKPVLVVTPNADSTCGVRGVCFVTTTGYWQASGQRGGKRTTLYYGSSFDKAVEARKAWENEQV